MRLLVKLQINIGIILKKKWVVEQQKMLADSNLVHGRSPPLYIKKERGSAVRSTYCVLYYAL